MDWSALLGALIGAAAGVLGSFVSSWALLRKDRIAFQRDRVTSTAFEYLRDCDKLLDLEIVLVIFQADCARRGLAPAEVLSEDDRTSVVSARRAAETGLGELAILCPLAFKEARALYDAAHNVSVNDTISTGNDDGVDISDEVEQRYMLAKSDFIKRIRKSAGL